MHVGEVEGKEEEVGGNLFDVGEGAVTDAVRMNRDDRVSPRAPSKSVQLESEGIQNPLDA